MNITIIPYLLPYFSMVIKQYLLTPQDLRIFHKSEDKYAVTPMKNSTISYRIRSIF
jgi:hypothetical protein